MCVRTNAKTNIPDNGFINTLNVIALNKLTIDNFCDFSLNKNINISMFYKKKLLLGTALLTIKSTNNFNSKMNFVIQLQAIDHRCGGLVQFNQSIYYLKCSLTI